MCEIKLHATARVEAGNRPWIAQFSFSVGGQMIFDKEDVDWTEAVQLIEQHGLDHIHGEVGVLGGLRAEASLSYRLQDFLPASVGFRGQDAPSMLSGSRDRSTLDAWTKEYLGVTYEVDREVMWDSFRVTARWKRGSEEGCGRLRADRAGVCPDGQ